jgi:RND family efflux transporter MFP subunit
MRRVVWVVALLAAGGLAWAVAVRLTAGDGGGGGRGARGPAPVEVAPVERGAIEQRRVYAGTLEARARFVVAAHVGGRVERLLVDLSDPVRKGQVVAELDDKENAQSVAEAAAELAVARANSSEAESALEIARREIKRLDSLAGEGIVSEQQLDGARSVLLARKSTVEVARAQVTRARAALQRARIRSGYAQVIAVWSGGDDQRVVAERHVHTGDTVAPNDPIVTVVDLEPIDVVVYVTEKEYGRLAVGQPATITTEAFPDREFAAEIRRIAPIFREATRQARVELEVPNEERLLKPGMFVRARVVLGKKDDATIVPLAALTTRDGVSGVFVVDPAGDKVSWRPVRVGIRDGERVAVEGEGVEGRVVTLGQQLIDDGAAIVIPEVGQSGASSGGS